jgi:anti-anti-sigma regulatory factor
MTTATVCQTETPVVAVTTLADGLVVRLAGALGRGAESLLREALLRPRPAACRDILVDAGDVEAIDDDALAVLLAAPSWADETGGQLSFTRISVPLQRAADGIGLFPMLPPAGTREG